MNQKFLERYNIDGLYQDWGSVLACSNRSHGCGYNNKPTYPIIADREVRKRIYKIFKRKKPDNIIIGHTSSCLVIPIASFFDAYLDGEHLGSAVAQAAGDYTKVVSLEAWRAEYMGKPFGLIPLFLPMFDGRFDPAEKLLKQEEPTECLMGLLLLHDIIPWAIWCNPAPIFKVWEALDKFGATAEWSKFLGYWEQHLATPLTPEIKVSVYKIKDKYLLIIFNLSEQPQVATVIINLQAQLAAKDALTGEPIELTQNKLTAKVKQKNFRLILLE